jgi:hypothetical protein
VPRLGRGEVGLLGLAPQAADPGGQLADRRAAVGGLGGGGGALAGAGAGVPARAAGGVRGGPREGARPGGQQDHQQRDHGVLGQGAQQRDHAGGAVDREQADQGGGEAEGEPAAVREARLVGVVVADHGGGHHHEAAGQGQPPQPGQPARPDLHQGRRRPAAVEVAAAEVAGVVVGVGPGGVAAQHQRPPPGLTEAAGALGGGPAGTGT